MRHPGILFKSILEPGQHNLWIGKVYFKPLTYVFIQHWISNNIMNTLITTFNKLMLSKTYRFWNENKNVPLNLPRSNQMLIPGPTRLIKVFFLSELFLKRRIRWNLTSIQVKFSYFRLRTRAWWTPRPTCCSTGRWTTESNRFVPRSTDFSRKRKHIRVSFSSTSAGSGSTSWKTLQSQVRDELNVATNWNFDKFSLINYFYFINFKSVLE